MSGSGAAAQVAPLKGMQLGVTSIALALGTFMQVLDNTIANVSLPTIAGNLGASTDQGTWIITSFAVSNRGCRAADRKLAGMGRYGVVADQFVISVLLFTACIFTVRHCLEPYGAHRVSDISGRGYRVR